MARSSVEKTAVTLGPAPCTAAVPMARSPSKNTTLPLGTPPSAVTVAGKRTEGPTGDIACDEDRIVDVEIDSAPTAGCATAGESDAGCDDEIASVDASVPPDDACARLRAELDGVAASASPLLSCGGGVFRARDGDSEPDPRETGPGADSGSARGDTAPPEDPD